jgi:hypothetical protein
MCVNDDHMSSLLVSAIVEWIIITSGYPWPSDTVRCPSGPVRATQAGLARPLCPVHPRLARWAHRLAPNCITHPHWMYKRPWHLARPPAAAALAAIRECLGRTHRQTDATFTVCKWRPQRRRTPLPLATNATQHASPFPSQAGERKERDDRARVPRPVSATTPETHGPCSGPPVAKSLVHGPGPGSSWGDRASSPPRFNTYSRGSTHLGAVRPAPSFFFTVRLFDRRHPSK